MEGGGEEETPYDDEDVWIWDLELRFILVVFILLPLFLAPLHTLFITQCPSASFSLIYFALCT